MTISRRRSRGVLEGSTPGSAADQEPERGQAWLDAQRGFESESQPGRGQAWLDAQRGYKSESEPGRGQVWLDAQRGFEPEEEQKQGQALLDFETEGPPTRPTGPDLGRRKGFGSQQQSGREPGKRTGLGSGRRSDRPKKPRPERSPEERAQRTVLRRELAAADVAADPTAAAKSIVLRQLTMGARTRAQLRQAMARKDIPEDVATAVLDRFEEVNLVDDKEFSRQWVQSRHLGRGLAARALAYELRQRGIAEETLKDAVEKVTPADELAAARELVRRKAATMRNDDPQRRMRRLAGMLARKGYGGGVAMRAIREELADLADLDLPEEDDPDLG